MTSLSNFDAVNARTILASVHPRYAAAILAGTKKYEFRRVAPKFPVANMYFYATAPESRVVAVAAVAGVKTLPHDMLWALTCAAAGISLAEYQAYFAGCSEATAFCLGEVSEFSLSLADFGLSRPPQSWQYVRDPVL